MHATPALALFGTLGTPELLIILFVVLLLFGAAKLPQLGSAFGKTIKNFKTEMKEGMAEEPPKETGAGGAKFCAKCGAESKDSEAAFCPRCGQKL